MPAQLMIPLLRGTRARRRHFCFSVAVRPCMLLLSRRVANGVNASPLSAFARRCHAASVADALDSGSRRTPSSLCGGYQPQPPAAHPMRTAGQLSGTLRSGVPTQDLRESSQTTRRETAQERLLRWGVALLVGSREPAESDSGNTRSSAKAQVSTAQPCDIHARPLLLSLGARSASASAFCGLELFRGFGLPCIALIDPACNISPVPSTWRSGRSMS